MYTDYKDYMCNVSNYWKHFKIAELTEVMRQREDLELISLLNNVRVDNYDKLLLKSWFISCEDSNDPEKQFISLQKNAKC